MFWLLGQKKRICVFTVTRLTLIFASDPTNYCRIRHFTGNFENEISDSGTGNDYFPILNPTDRP